MNCFNEIQHRITYGDNLYSLAVYYNTTVEEILLMNRNINPYNLRIGDILRICPNTNERVNKKMCITQNAMNLSDEMNTLWEQHVFWTRLFLISVSENLKDLEETEKRLLRNPADIANIYRRYYGNDVAQKIQNLLTEHLKIGGDLIVALKNKDNAKAQELNKKWYKNADEIAEFLSSINPYYNKQELQQMLYEHLALTTEEVKARLRGDYKADIEAFDKVEKEALKMASYFTRGIWKQFRDMF
ncbi:MAG: LysM peptidoglycan-binding domain-containing protein [Clostridia bacterium]